MPVPTKTDWEKSSDNFHNRWQFPNCCGAVDGKYCVIVAPLNTSSLYFNYKKTFSVVLLAVVDAFYKFVLVEIGSMGSEGDNSIFRNYAFGNTFMKDNMNFPDLRFLPGTETLAPFVWVGDDAFLNKSNLLKPYPKNPTFRRFPNANPEPLLPHELKKTKVFNYRLSHAQMVVECAFSIMASRFRFLMQHMTCQLETATSMIKAACILHNFL